MSRPALHSLCTRPAPALGGMGGVGSESRMRVSDGLWARPRLATGGGEAMVLAHITRERRGRLGWRGGGVGLRLDNLGTLVSLAALTALAASPVLARPSPVQSRHHLIGLVQLLYKLRVAALCVCEPA
eukprot:scaffold10490_cov66-Phaeocystis_antarctica.AAC.1